MARPTPPDALPWRGYVGYALGDTASNLFFQTFNIFLTYYYVDVWGLLPGAVATLMLVVRLWDAVNDPLMGLIADRTVTRWGRYRPYLLWVAPFYGLCGYLIFANPPLPAAGKLPYAYATYTLMLMAYTAINVPYSALLGVLSPSSRTRTVAASFRFVGAFGGGLLVALFIRPLVRALGAGDEVAGFQRTMALFALLSLALFWLCFATTRERVAPPARQRSDVRGELAELGRNGPWRVLLVAAVCSTTFIALRSGSTLFYFKYVAGDTGEPVWLGRLDRTTVFLASGMAAMMVGAAALGAVARRVDKRRLAIALTLLTAAAFGAGAAPALQTFGWLLALNAAGMFCLGPTSALVWSMYADVADYGEWKFGRRSTGLIYSASLFALKTGAMAAGWLLPVLLARCGYVRGGEQTATAVLGITLAFTVGPALFAGLKAVALWRYPLRQALVDGIERDLADRRRTEARETG